MFLLAFVYEYRPKSKHRRTEAGSRSRKLVLNRVNHGVCWGAHEGNRVAKQQFLSPLLQAGQGRGEGGEEEGKS